MFKFNCIGMFFLFAVFPLLTAVHVHAGYYWPPQQPPHHVTVPIIYNITNPEVLRLTEDLEDEQSSIRIEAAKSLGEMGPTAKDAIPALVGVLQDNDSEVAWAAFYALEKILPDYRMLSSQIPERDAGNRAMVSEALKQMNIFLSQEIQAHDALSILDQFKITQPLPAYGEMTIYTVKKGDSLWEIARRFDTTVDEIIRLNSIANPDMIRSGQEIQIPFNKKEGETDASRGEVIDHKDDPGTLVIDIEFN